MTEKFQELLLQDFPCPVTFGWQEACDWTGKREAELRIAESVVGKERKKNGCGFDQPQVVRIS